MDPRSQESYVHAPETVSNSEVDQMLRMVLAGEVQMERRRPLSEVAESLGLSDEQAQKVLQQVRAKNIAEQEKMRVSKGLNREKQVLQVALMGSVLGLFVIGFMSFFGLTYFGAHPAAAAPAVSAAPVQATIDLTAPEPPSPPGVIDATPYLDPNGSITYSEPPRVYEIHPVK